MAIKTTKRKIPAAKAKKKELDILEVPIRAEIPVGTKFRFVGKKNVYQCVKALGNGVTDCDNCAFKGAKKRALCSSVVCSANAREDKQTVRYVFDHPDIGEDGSSFRSRRK